MNVRTITAAAFGSLALAACSGADDATKADAAADTATDTAATAPAGEVPASPPVDSAMAGSRDTTTYPAGQTPPTLPVEPDTTSPATSPPPQ